MNFTLTSPQGLPIHGDFSVPERPRGLVIVVHGFKGFKDWGFFPWLAERLAVHRLVACRFNMSRSGVGESGDEFDRLDLFEEDSYSTQLADLRTVVEYAQSRFPELPTFLVGHSRGGGVALLAAQDVPRLKAVVTWSAISHLDRWDDETKRAWRESGFLEVLNARTKQVMRMGRIVLDDYEENRERLDVLAATERLTVPLLVVHGERDESVPVEEGRAIAAKAKDVSLVVIPRASHTYNAIHPLVHVPFELTLAAEVTAHFCNAYVHVRG